jgi:hypothetical protein
VIDGIPRERRRSPARTSRRTRRMRSPSRRTGSRRTSA